MPLKGSIRGSIRGLRVKGFIGLGFRSSGLIWFKGFIRFIGLLGFRVFRGLIRGVGVWGFRVLEFRGLGM